jgi:hypothetical protein
MIFEIDVSGENLLSTDYTICIANSESIIKGFKFNSKIINIINSRYGQGIYKYQKSDKGKANLKVRIYCIVLYYLFLDIREKLKNKEITLTLCKDFDGKENEIRMNLEYFLIKKLGLKLNLEDIYFGKLSKTSNAHNYSYLMRKDTKNQLKNYVKIELIDIEKYLIE